MRSEDELVALYDSHDQVSGSAPRSVMRRCNLRHGATSVIVRDAMGRVYVHRRTEAKDVYPGMYDFCAGGVVLAGEQPADAAERELSEELGITGVDLEPLLISSYSDEHVSCVYYLYEAAYTGEVTHDPEEIAWGEWLSPEDLLERMGGDDWEFSPDSTAVARAKIEEWTQDRQQIDGSVSSNMSLVEDKWIEREPRRPEAEQQLRAEVALHTVVADRLPLAIPRPAIVHEQPLRVRHTKVPGHTPRPSELTADHGYLLGTALARLHDIPVDDVPTGAVTDPATAWAEIGEMLDEYAQKVIPALPEKYHPIARALVDAARRKPLITGLIHGDIGPDHVLLDEGELTGIIDWGNAAISDPAIDLAWPLFGTPDRFARAVAAAYEVSEREQERALVWFILQPWEDIAYGLQGGPSYILETAVARAIERLEMVGVDNGNSRSDANSGEAAVVS